MATITREDINSLIEIEITLKSLMDYADLPKYQMEWVIKAKKKASNLLYQNEQTYLAEMFL